MARTNRRYQHRDPDPLLTSFLDVLGNGVGAAVLLFLIFSTSQGLSAPQKKLDGGSLSLDFWISLSHPQYAFALILTPQKGDPLVVPIDRFADKRRLVDRHLVMLRGKTFAVHTIQYAGEQSMQPDFPRDVAVTVEGATIGECWHVRLYAPVIAPAAAGRAGAPPQLEAIYRFGTTGTQRKTIVPLATPSDDAVGLMLKKSGEVTAC